MNQHEWVQTCTKKYKEQGLTPGDPDDGEWQDAHYPAPKGVGVDTVLLLFDDHQVQGLLQSEEYGRCCFFNDHTRKFLTQKPFTPNWFELWDLYDKWSGYNARMNNEKNSVVLNAHPNTAKGRLKGGKKTGPVNAKKLNSHPNTIEGRRIRGKRFGKQNAERTNSQKWRCLETGHVSTPGPLTNYQRARDIDTTLRVRVE